MSDLQQVLDFWFTQPAKIWFNPTPEFDEELRSRFLSLYQQAAQGELDEHRESPLGCLALIILLDQFPRNVFRGQPQAFATDTQALTLAKYAVKNGFDSQLLPVQRWFIYLPYEHSENLSDQQTCVELFASLKDDPQSQSAINYAYRHFEVIERFGRFPHRNAILNRESTPAEQEFLQQPGSRF